MKHKKISWLIATLFTTPLMAQQAFAQEAAPAAIPATPAAAAPTPAAPAPAPAPAAASDDVQQVKVTGIRASVRNALAAKEASNSMVEVISSEDIGKLPDTTIAESLARLPGMSSGLDRGNASQIVARGMGPRFIGATLNGRELASSEPNRAVRFEQFPSESLSGATVYKTQNAEIVEGGIATSIDLQTVSPLKYNGRQVSLRADALYYPIAKDIPGADKTAPRLGGVYIDQFLNKTVGVAIAASYQDQPSVQKNVKHYGFDESTADKRTPWGFQDDTRRGKNERSSVLAKVEWKPNNNVLITADSYYSKAAIDEDQLQHWSSGLNNIGNYTDVNLIGNYVAGGTSDWTQVTNNHARWTQDSSVAASGVNGKFNAGDWKIETDLSTSHAIRASQWADLRQITKDTDYAKTTFSFTGNEQQSYDFGGLNTSTPASFAAPTLHIDDDGHVKDVLNGASVTASRAIESSFINRIKVGVRATDREKSYRQNTWTLNPLEGAALSDSAYETVKVDGFPAYFALRDFTGSIGKTFGANATDPTGRVQTLEDMLAGWKVKERSSSAFVQGDLDGEMMGKTYRGNVGVRLVHTKTDSYGMQSINNGTPTAVSSGTSYTEILPSLNLIFNMDEAQEHQVRFSVARAMSRPPLDELRASRSLATPTIEGRPVTGSAGNPDLKPMMANQIDLAYQWYFSKGSLLSAGAFYKNVQRYIAITQAENITRSVNGTGGNIRGLELVYQQAFTFLPAPFDGLGVASNYAYTNSSIREQVPTTNPFPVEGLMKHNGGVTLWYEKAGYEARLSANYHSSFVRNPGWDAGQLLVNGEETYLTLNLSKQLTPNLQLRFGIDNLTNQKSVYTSGNNRLQQEVTDFGRRFNLGLTFKL
ncbi:MAG TPA: TonB-dependent receptor [Duganella sp.]